MAYVHLTGIIVKSVYYGFVSISGIQLLMLLSDINGMETWDTDIGNTYLEVKSLDKVYIISGAEFGDREGCTLIFS